MIKTRQLQVVNKPSGKKYVPGFNLQGNYIAEAGFEYGSKCNVIITDGKIIIQRTNEQ